MTRGGPAQRNHCRGVDLGKAACRFFGDHLDGARPVITEARRRGGIGITRELFRDPLL